MRDLGFDDMHLFARVAELGTLSAVARERDAPVSQVSRSLTRIETACGARLLHRSTHGLSLTPEGETFLAYCHRITGTLDELEGEFASTAREASGRVRVAVSSVIAQFQMVPSLAGLAARHPRLNVELQVDDRLADMARDGIDIAIRTGSMVLQGLGIGQLATLVGDPMVKAKRLVRVLEDFTDVQAVPIFAVTKGARHRLPKIAACLAWWTAWFGGTAPATQMNP